AKTLPFGGTFDPYKHQEAALPAAVMLPRRGTDLGATTRVAQADPELLTYFAAAKALVAKGVAMSPELVSTLKGLHPEGGVPETEIDALVARLTVRAGLRVVGGGL
ncbi:MAG: transposase, partial [Burkholderiaceae bacterium]|nr:transposase [Burkholderiaceae bacterium]